MAQALAEKVALPVRQAFVVQLSTETEGERGHWAGRVEHVVSGQAAHFSSVEELLAFLTQVLHTVRTQSSEEV
jgi:hypothetical protein